MLQNKGLMKIISYVNYIIYMIKIKLNENKKCAEKINIISVLGIIICTRETILIRKNIQNFWFFSG